MEMSRRFLSHPVWVYLGIVLAIIVVLQLLHPRVKMP